MRVLLVEDDDPKRERIISHLNEMYPQYTIDIAKSVRSAIQNLKQEQPDLLLLDMSLNTFDMGINESGGRPQGFGGLEVLNYMMLIEIYVPFIMITQYEIFSRDGQELNHDSLRQELKQKFPKIFKGLVYYNSVYDTWKNELSTLINQATVGD